MSKDVDYWVEDGKDGRRELKKSDLSSGKIYTVGWFVEGGLFISERDAKTALNRVHNGWSLHVASVDVIKDEGARYICIRERGVFQEDYFTDLKAFDDFGIEEGDQIVLPKKYWSPEMDWKKPSRGYVHLHLHSEFSTLDGVSHPEEIALRARRMNMDAVALTDHGTLFGIYKFHRVCRQVGVKPIIGCELYFVPDATDKETRERFHIVALAKNPTGYKNLLKLVSRSHLEGFYYRPRVDRKMLEEHKEGLVITSACMSGVPIRMHLEGKSDDEIVSELQWWKDTFGDDYYLEIQPDKMEEYIKSNPVVVRLSKRMGIPLVTTNDSHYTFRKDKELHDAIRGISIKKSIHEQHPTTDVYWMMSKQDVEEHYQEFHPQIAFEDYEQAIKNTQAIADKIEDYEIESDVDLPTINEETEHGNLSMPLKQFMVYEKRPEYLERMKYELGVIKELGYKDYFLLIADIIQFAKSKGIQVGAGRGSVSGSLVAYVLGITEVDPIEHGLIFERFLNPARKVMPDIDIDFDASRRDEVTAYINSKWKTAKISTFVALQSKGALKDCCRYLGIHYGIAETLSKLFPVSQTTKHTIDSVILDVPEFRQAFERYPDLFRISRRIEGRIKTKGIHPAGVIVSEKELSDTVALRYSNGSSGDVVVQCDMEDVDALGLLKIDCLGSKTQTTLSIAKKLAGVEDLRKIPLDDKKVYREFCKGNTWDIFQFQSELGHETVMKVKPEDFESLAAITALVRPGAYDFIDRFAKGDYEPIMEELKPILKDTRNIILYQEQAMKIAVEIAGFSLEKADDLRKAIGKKKADVMAKLRRDFIEGGVKMGHDQLKIAELFSFIERSANYSFNKSHAVAYTLCSYWSMWFKVHHKIAWATAELTVQVDDEEKLKRYLEDASNNGIEVIPPDVNKSAWGFTIEDDKIRCGLGMVKRFSEKAYAELETKRPIANINDFMVRVDSRKCNKGAIQSLIKAGAFDSLHKSRKTIFSYVEKAKKATKKQREAGSFFKGMDFAEDDWDEKEKAKFEREAIGFYLQGSPLQYYKDQLAQFEINPKIGYLVTGRTVRVAGIVQNIKEWMAKTGEMAFIDLSGMKDYSINVWPSSWLTYKGHITEGQPVVVFARRLEGDYKLAVDVEKGDKFEFLK